MKLNSTKYIKQPFDLDFLISILPEQGCLELQRDQPFKVHDWHEHSRDETLIVLDGEIKFSLPQGEITCRRGGYINLPAGTWHRSSTEKQSCVYIIAFCALNLV